MTDELTMIEQSAYDRGFFDGFNAGIHSMREDLEKSNAERDAAIADLKGIVADSEIDIDPCYYCKYREEDGQCFHDCFPFSGKWGWEWRGANDE